MWPLGLVCLQSQINFAFQSAATGQHAAASAEVAPLRASEWLVLAILRGGPTGSPYRPLQLFSSQREQHAYLDKLCMQHCGHILRPLKDEAAGTWLVRQVDAGAAHAALAAPDNQQQQRQAQPRPGRHAGQLMWKVAGTGAGSHRWLVHWYSSCEAAGDQQVGDVEMTEHEVRSTAQEWRSGLGVCPVPSLHRANFVCSALPSAV